MVNGNIDKMLVYEDFLKLSQTIRELLPFSTTKILFNSEEEAFSQGDNLTEFYTNQAPKKTSRSEAIIKEILSERIP